ncbi:MAG: DUF5011 domain-containing protein [Bacilli bacterium]|nr:DUF5011 domain-containing protein [Bacilli bacterium]
MGTQNENTNSKRIRSMIIVCTLTAIVLSVSTYAWFVGMRTVNVSSFDVQIASTDSLLLSLDGSSWDTTVNISSDTYNTASYVGNTNNWGGRGLIPVSSIGELDSAVSRMKLFEKASLTTTPGGYRLMASRVNNYANGDPEQDGYVVFDLFVRNFSGNQYIQALNEADEEAIYLTIESAVIVADGGVANTGIENSVRVAFAQIGRVSGFTTEAGTITGITCTSDASVTGICRTAQIWEPNDRDHVSNAISWYDTSCLARTGTDVTLDASYAGDCGTVIDGLAYPTYAVKEDIASSDNVDIYDGAAYNGYFPELEEDQMLYAYPYFTDSMKLLTGTERPTFMTLSPNSITKVRIYIYIEGQDVDNYDYASIGKKISVNFGFTKERYTEDDTNYDGPDLNEGDGPAAADTTDPVITLLGDNPMTVVVGNEYVEPGATATDNVDTTEAMTSAIIISGTVNTSVVGTYRVDYEVTDTAGNKAIKTRTVNVVAS